LNKHGVPPFVFVFCDGSPHLTLKTKFGSLVSYPSRNLSDSVAGFVQLIEIHSRFLVQCIMVDVRVVGRSKLEQDIRNPN